ncbi:unnamed protein product [Calicophoron daubneyi]|uniref:Saposin B-type domain-containing protein n=1 Tax=Calicophoron daubneyi TaxID=300641 RepID=A0AAV2TA43_CALDB
MYTFLVFILIVQAGGQLWGTANYPQAAGQQYGNVQGNPDYCNFGRLAEMIKAGVPQAAVEALINITCKEITFKGRPSLPPYCAPGKLDQMREFGIPRYAIEEVLKQKCNLERPQGPNQYLPLPDQGDLCSICKKSFADLLKLVQSKSTKMAITRFIDDTCVHTGHKEEKCWKRMKKAAKYLSKHPKEADPLKVCTEVKLCKDYDDDDDDD